MRYQHQQSQRQANICRRERAKAAPAMLKVTSANMIFSYSRHDATLQASPPKGNAAMLSA